MSPNIFSVLYSTVLRFQFSSYSTAEPVFVNLLRSPGTGYQTCGDDCLESIPLGSLNVYKYGVMPAFNLDFALWSSVYIILQGSQGAYAVFVVYYES
jgi:hypothetical protein